jgi:thioredoxin reductase/SAM-dependent methyltransferase
MVVGHRLRSVCRHGNEVCHRHDGARILDAVNTTNGEFFEVVVVGGGAAGLSGALVLARSRRSVLLVDAGDPRNAPAAHAHNYLTRDGSPPGEIYDAGRDEVTSYGGRVERGRVSSISRDDRGFTISVEGRTVRARRVLVATGLRDELPDVPGLAQRWGRDVLHCPYCHGWEVRDQRIGVLATGPMAVHQALLFRQLSEHVTLLQHTAPTFDDEQREELDAVGITVVEGRVSRVDTDNDRLTGVVVDGRAIALDALVVGPRAAPRAELLEPLGVLPEEFVVRGQVLGARIVADATGATAVPGLWVAGNLGDPQAQVVTAAAQGVQAGAAINADLVAEDSGRAVAELRFERVHGEHAWDERYRSHERTWSGRPNSTLVSEVVGLPPGRALDAGAGEGADACWLAERGWQVTGVELSTVALGRAAEFATAAGIEVDWLHADLTREPAPGRFDLVTAHYVHTARDRQPRLFANLAAAVAPGGTLLIVGHDPSDAHTTMPRPHLDEMGWTAQEAAASLGEGWIVEVAEARPRQATDPHGNKVAIRDAVMRARRRAD